MTDTDPTIEEEPLNGPCEVCSERTWLHLGDPPHLLCIAHLAEYQHVVRADQHERRADITEADAQFLGMTLKQLQNVAHDPPAVNDG